MRINKKGYRYHRLMWIFLNGSIPDSLQIDHINHDRLDNRIENLRLVSNVENGRNKSMNMYNRSGASGVSWHSRDKVWTAQIRVNYKLLHLGYFDNRADAYVRYKWACRKYNFHENHGKQY